MEMANRFVKSATTSVPVSRTQAELERLLGRYGCSCFGVQNNYEQMRVAVSFIVPDSLEPDAPKIPVRLELDVRAVYDQLYGRPVKRKWVEGESIVEWNPAGYDERDLKQAERVAWRQLVLWVDAACSAAAAGVQKMSEAFFAHTIVRGDDGRGRRLVDHMDYVTQGNWRALLTSGEAPEARYQEGDDG
jgi:hypothetical protein